MDAKELRLLRAVLEQAVRGWKRLSKAEKRTLLEAILDEAVRKGLLEELLKGAVRSGLLEELLKEAVRRGLLK